MGNKKKNIILIGSSVHDIQRKIKDSLGETSNVICIDSYEEGLNTASDHYPDVDLIVISEALSDKDELYNLAMNIHPGEVFVIAELDQGIKCEQRPIGDMHIQHVNSKLPKSDIVSHIC
tara:strand:- start:1558 stop:1914 length:357 start_codon:yes stop_codon:yes gene_type:complete